MVLHALFSLLSTVICFSLACFVYIKNRRSIANQIFSLLCFCFSYLSFIEFQVRQAESVQHASYWINLSCIWTLIVSLLFHFAITHANKSKNSLFKFLKVFIYACAIFFAFTNVFYVKLTPSYFYWGWSYKTPHSFFYLTSQIWAIITTLFSMTLLVLHLMSTQLKSIKRQTQYILLGTSIVFLSGLLSECILPLFSIRIPELTQTSFSLMAAFTFLAIWRHQLFAIAPSVAAETIISTMSDSLIVVNLDHKIEIVNKSLLTLLGYSENELLGKDLNIIIGDFKYQGSTLTTLLKKNFLSDIETVFYRKDGITIPVSLSWSVLKDSDRFKGFVFIGRDMTERERIKGALQKAHDELERRVEERTAELKKSNEQLLYEISERISMEQKLETEKEKLSVTLRSIGDGVITTDSNGAVVLLNKAAEDLIGYSLDVAAGKKLTDIYRTEKTIEHGSHSTNIIDEIETTKNLNQIERQSVLISRTGTRYIISETGVSIKDHQKNTFGHVIVFRDITEKKKLEEELFKARKLESVSLLASGISHDFNSLLTGIITNLFMAKIGVGTSSDSYQLITSAEKAAFKASSLIKQLLTFANSDNSIKEGASIKELIESSIGFYLKNSKSEYKLVLADDMFFVNIDRGQIDQVLNNIIANSDQAMPEGGIITISGENVDIDDNQAIPLPKGKYVKITISDQGQGISPEILQKIFDPFFTTRKENSGLGLTTAYAIIQKHGGHISVASHVGVGTDVTIYLPAQIKEKIKENTDDYTEVATQKLNFNKILFVDDEQIILKSTGKILSHLGYDVCLAESSIEAVQFYKTSFEADNSFSVVIMDLTISGGQGAKEALAQLQSIDPDVKVIVSSGYIDDPVMKNYESFGFCGAMPKPYDIDELNEKIQRIIELEKSSSV